MRKFLPKNLIWIAQNLPKPLFVVGGAVRNFLIDGSISQDLDLAGTIPINQFVQVLGGGDIKISAIYSRTGTVMFKVGDYNCEYTAFRKEKYVGGTHTPISTQPTDNIVEDALRRDFKCNAVYYDILNEKLVDPLGGINDINNKIIDTVDGPDIVFSADGLRLMRLARFVGELNFKPTYDVIKSATKFADNILDISKERIFTELKLIINADKKYAFSDPLGHYNALKVLDQTKVLDRIMPDLAEGRGMVQRADFHKYDVLEHSLRSVMYADPEVRLAALFHDIGKPYCFKRDGYYYHHFEEGERIAERVLKSLGADKNTIKQVKFLVKEHMVDLDCSMKESKVRRFIQRNHDMLEQLLMVKQADFRASLEIDDTAPTLVKWNRIYDKMLKDGTPFTLKQLEINASDLIEIGYKDQQISKELKALFDFAGQYPQKNNKQALFDKAKEDYLKYGDKNNG